MSDINFYCPLCGHNLTVDENGAGLVVTCPECSKPIRIPTALKADLTPCDNDHPHVGISEQRDSTPSKKNFMIRAAIAYFLAGVVLASLLCYFVFWRSSHSSKTLPCEVLPNEPINISNFQIKLLDVEMVNEKKKSGAVPQQRMATIQWRCNVENTSTNDFGYILKVELLDREGFVLTTDSISGSNKQGDILAGHVQAVHSDIVMGYLPARAVASARVTPTALKSRAQINQEQAAWQEANRAEQQSALQRSREWAQFEAKEKEKKEAEKKIIEARQKEHLVSVRKIWLQLRKGMSEAQVESILGKPENAESLGPLLYKWEYPRVEGFYATPSVLFSVDTRSVYSWSSP